MKFRTLSIHGPDHHKNEGAVVDPIFLSSSYVYANTATYGENRYGRLSNTPNHQTLGKKLAAMEGYEAALVLGSGMAVISTAMLALVPVGGTLAVQDQVYGGTHAFLTERYEALGRKIRWLPIESFDDEASAKRALDGASAVYVESISNPLLRTPELANVVKAAKAHRIPSMIDNTFLSPALFQPAALGFDVVLHSATKYLNGHSDVIAGTVAGSKAHIDNIWKWSHHLGASLDPFACYLLERGMKTLGIRMQAQVDGARRVAKALREISNVESVNYPGFDDHPDAARIEKYFRGPGTMLSFLSKFDAKETDKRMAALQYATAAPSLGAVESLVCRPAATSHSGLTAAERKKVGVDDRLVRVSVGLEDPEDLIGDFARVLA